MKLFTKAFPVLLLVVSLQQALFSQSCPSINAQAGTGASTTICSGQCAALTATVVPVNTTTTYSVGSIGYSPFAFTGGTLAIGDVDDVWSSPINIGFNFCYFGNTFNRLLLGSNGEITFDLSYAAGPEFFSVNQTLPDITEHPVNTICGAYRDIDPSDTSMAPKPTINYYVSGAAPCRVFVANWTDVPLYRCKTPTSTFQIVLYESTNIIQVFINNSTTCPIWQNGRGIIGIQDGTGTTAVAPASRNTLSPWSATNEAWQFMPTGAPNYTVTWSGSDGFTSTGLTAAPCPTATTNYTATMNVARCGGGSSSYTSAVQVLVTPTPSLVATASPTAICLGSSSILSATGATSYTWSPGGATTASISVTPTVTTTYTVRGANGSCVSTQTITLGVNANPTITASSNPTVVCSNNSATLTSTGASTYTWNPGALVGNTVVVTPTVATVYTVTATSLLGCTATRTLNLNVSSSPTITASASATTVCAGGTVTLSGSGGTSYTWTPGPLTGTNVVVAPATNTTYTVLGRNAAGCSATNTIAISTTPGITVTASASPTIICRGGSSTLTATGASSYTWNPGGLTGNTVTVTPAATTVYSVTGSDLGCTNTKTVSVTVSIPNVVATKIPTTSVCAGNSATLSASGAVTYTWSPGGATGTPIVITPTATTLYTVTGTNALGCTGTRTINVVVAANPTINAVANPTSICAGTSATLSASGGISYTWLPGLSTATTIVVSPTVTTTYTVTGRNATCAVNKTVTLNVTPAVTVTPVSSPSVICSGGSSTLSATGATSYTWNPGALTGSLVSVSPAVTTTYSVTGVNALGCTDTKTVNVTISTVSINATSNPTILCSANTATLTAAGANTYTWNPGALTGGSVVVTPATTTIYTVTGTNAIGCTASQTLNLSVGNTPTIGVSASSNTICEGAVITLTATGGTTYTWNPGGLSGTTVTVSPVSNTIYTVTGANASGCQAFKTTTITVSPTPTIIADSDPVILCSGQTATLNASGASTYTWNPGAMGGATLTVSPIVTTVYTVTATSSLGCIGSGTVNLKVSPNPTVTASASPSVMCQGNTTTLTANGAASYTWNPGALTGSSVAVSPTINTTYTVTGNNGLGCISTQTLMVAVNASPTLTASSSPTIICAGNQSTLTAGGATSYTWNPGALSGSTVVVTPTTTTTYTVDGSNGTGCVTSQTVSVAVSVPTISISATSTVLCAPGSITLTASGGLTYTWSPVASSTASVTDSPTITTTYTVTSDNGIGCIGSQTVTVNVSSMPSITVSASSNTICAGSTATLTATGASSYTWNPGALSGATVVVNPATSTTYTVNGDNGFGCVSSQTIAITTTPGLTLTPSSTSNTLCAGSPATLTIGGASTYTWNPGALTGATVVVTPTTTTTYTVNADNGSGCTGTASLTINVNTVPTLSISATSTLLCSSGTVTLTANGATSYTWMPLGATTPTVSDNPSVTTTYTVTGSNGTGCVDTKTITINVSATPTVIASATSTTICAGNTVTLTAGGASTYTWNPGALTGTNVTVSPTVTTTYTVDGDNGAGCVDSETITVNVNTVPSLSITASSTVLCSAGSITLTASGGTTYTWNPGGTTTASIVDSPTITTTYTVLSDNAAGCTGTQTITVNVGAPPSLTITAMPVGTICAGTTATLTASGAASYTWNPTAATTAAITDNPATTTTYTVTGDNGFGCTATNTFVLNVAPGSSITAIANPSTACANSTINLSASGATSYTWLPMGSTGASVTATPSVSTTYTALGDNGTCVATGTVFVNITSPQNVTATVSGDITCLTPSVNLFGNTTSSPVVYLWTGPGSYTSTAQNPTGITQGGVYTLGVIDLISGCISTATVSVLSNTTIPGLAATSSGSLGCAGTVTLNATSTSTNALTYAWSGPASFTAAVQNPTTTLAGSYTVSASDALTGCTSTATVTIATTTATPTLTATVSGSLSCIGNVTLTATSTSTNTLTYAWSGPVGFTSAVQNPTTSVAGNYTVSVTDGSTGCSTTTMIAVGSNTVGPNLTASASGSLGCVGTVTLNATSTSTNTLAYAWSGPSSFTSAVQNPTINVAGDYTVIVTDATSGCNTTTMVTVGTSTAVPTVTASVSSDLGCVASVTLTAASTSTNTLTYAWSGPSSFTAAVQNPTINVAGDYTITVNDATTECSSTATVTVGTSTVVPTVTASVSSDLGCVSSVTLTATSTSTNTLTYAWSGPSSFTAAVQNPTINVAGDYTITVNDATTGCSSTVTITVGTSTAVPTVTASVSSDLGCVASVTLTAASTSTNTLTYAWSGPSSFTAAVQNPTINVAGDYTITVNDATTGCSSTATITVGTSTAVPTVTASVSSDLGCVSSVTLTATSTSTNTLTYAWSGPSSFTAAVQNPTINVAGDYTITVNDATTGCNSTATITVGTSTAVPTVTASVSSGLGCVSSVTLTATSTSTNTLTYAWSGPSSFTAAVQNPTINVAGDYTITVNDATTGCSSTATVTVGTSTVTIDLTATASGSVNCTGSVTLTATSTNTNTLTYAWSGPSGFTTAVQNPTINVAGDYTITITDATSGCSTSSIVSVGSNSVVPVVGIVVPGPVLGCNAVVTLAVITAPTPTLTFDWSGPASFTSTAQYPTTTVAGDYTVTVTDPSNGCQNTVAVTVGFSTVVPVYSATITPATCTGSVTNNDGTIMISGNSLSDNYDISQSATYTGTATYATANAIPFSGILTNTLVNPAVATPYTIRVFSSNGCFKDTTVMLTPVNCGGAPVTTLGMTKAAGTPTFVNNSAYNVTYTIVATNASAGDMTNFSIIDNLVNTFPTPTTFSLITPPVVTSINSSLTINAGYDGSLQTDLLSPLTSTLGAGKKDTIVFTVQINPNGLFGPFYNSAIGSGTDNNGVAVADSSNTGFAWDPDNDGDPTNNNIPTPVTLIAKPSIGVAKSGSATVLADKTVDVTYVITVKNLGNDTLRNVQVLDSLRIPAPAQYTIKSGPSASSGIAANSNYNGVSDIRLLDANLSKLAPGQTETVTFVLNITPNAVRSVTNTAIGLGLGSQGPIARDTSNNGSEPDPNGNLNANENGENIPTVVELPDVNLFIPEVFTPDGDGRNDFFVIKGIEGRTVKLTVFNRWGNKVYNNDAYDNTWSGVPNVSGLIIGSNKLPQGTYYYIIEFEDGADDPVNGYVVLQY